MDYGYFWYKFKSQAQLFAAVFVVAFGFLYTVIGANDDFKQPATQKASTAVVQNTPLENTEAPDDVSPATQVEIAEEQSSDDQETADAAQSDEQQVPASTQNTAAQQPENPVESEPSVPDDQDTEQSTEDAGAAQPIPPQQDQQASLDITADGCYVTAYAPEAMTLTIESIKNGKGGSTDHQIAAGETAYIAAGGGLEGMQVTATLTDAADIEQARSVSVMTIPLCSQNSEFQP